MGRIRVLVANRPRLVRDLLRATIADQPDMQIAAEVSSDSDVVCAAAEYRPDFIIISAEESYERPPICDDLLAQNPQVIILALAPEFKRHEFSWSVIDRKSMYVETSDQGISEQGILDTIRDRSRCGEGGSALR